MRRRGAVAVLVCAMTLAGCLGPAPIQVPVSPSGAFPTSPGGGAAAAEAPPGWLAAVCETLQPLQDAERLLSELEAQRPDDTQRRAILVEALVDAILEAELEAALIPAWPAGEGLRGMLERMTVTLAALVPSLEGGRGMSDLEPLASAGRQVQAELAELGAIREETLRLAGPIGPGCPMPAT